MIFWASAEVFKDADPALDRVRRLVEPFLNAAFAASCLSELDCELRFVPIVMPEDMHARYPARSELRVQERLYVCAPILDHATFVGGTFKQQLREYLRGFAETTPYLAELGATPEQVSEFEVILARSERELGVHGERDTYYC